MKNIRGLKMSEAELAAIEQFCSVTGASQDIAKQTLEACHWQVNVAINLHVDSGDGDGPSSNGGAATASSGSSGSHSKESSARQRPSHPVQADISDEVRAPIPHKIETLVTEGRAYGMSSAAKRRQQCVFRDIKFETQEQEERLNPSNSQGTKKPCIMKLETLFKPPLDILFHGTYEEAKIAASTQQLWLLLDIQHPQEFACLALNRDLWSQSKVKALIRSYCIMAQVSYESDDGACYCQFYKVPCWPHVALMHPTTHERLGSWTTETTSPGDKVTSFTDWFTMLVCKHPNPCVYDTQASVALPPTINSTEKLTVTALAGGYMAQSEDILDQTEDKQLQFVLQRSLGDDTLIPKHSPSEVSSCCSVESDNTGSDTDDDCSSPELSRPSSSLAEALQKPRCAASAPSAVSTETEKSNSKEWHALLGSDDDPKSNIVIRLPDQSRHQWAAPCSTKLQALLSYIQHLGYSSQAYDIVVNFPRRVLTSCDSESTLATAGLHPQETVYVHQR